MLTLKNSVRDAKPENGSTHVAIWGFALSFTFLLLALVSMFMPGWGQTASWILMSLAVFSAVFGLVAYLFRLQR